MGLMKGFARHSVCFLSFSLWAAGCGIIGCMLWIVVTSPVVKDFFMGTTIFSYVIMGIGGVFFLNGLVGWIASYRRGSCVMKLFLLVGVLTVAAEIGGIVAFNIYGLRLTDVLENGWKEVNDHAKNIVQDQLHCCGFLGPEDFTVNTDPIHESCYTKLTPGSGNTTAPTEVRKLNRIGCKEKLMEWFFANRFMWIGILAGILLLQVITVLFAVFVISQGGRRRRDSSTSLDIDVDPMNHHPSNPQPYF